jgi:hypothetical protein
LYQSTTAGVFGTASIGETTVCGEDDGICRIFVAQGPDLGNSALSLEEQNEEKVGGRWAAGGEP